MSEALVGALQRPDRSLDPVSGRIRYVDDLASSAGMLHVAFSLATQAPARIVDVDVSEALQMPGVVDAICGADVGSRYFGRALIDYPILAVHDAMFVGQRVAAVAATDARTARLAADLVRVTYARRAGVFDPGDARSADAPVLHPDYDDRVGARSDRQHPNEQGRMELRAGGDRWPECQLVVEATYRFDRNHSCPLEPAACIVDVGDDGVDIWSTNKTPFALRRNMADITGRPESDFDIHPVAIGGDFGSKSAVYLEGACYYLSKRTGRPVRSTMTFYEWLTSTGCRHPGEVSVRMGIRDGSIHVCELSGTLDGGAFAALKALRIGTVPVAGTGLSTYAIPNRSECCVSMYTNNLPAGHVRAPGEYQSIFATERHVDVVAGQLGIDPIEFRLRHSSDPRATTLLQMCRSKVIEWRRSAGPGRGIGVAIFTRDAGPGETSVCCTVDRDGAHFEVSVPDQGAGAYELVRRVAAIELAVDADRLTVAAMPTSRSLVDSGAGASRVTNVVGRAVQAVCQKVRDELVHEHGSAGRIDREPFWLGRRLDAIGLDSVTATATLAVSPDECGYSIGVLAVEVDVDVRTGIYDVVRAYLAADTGAVLNPVAHRGQLEGGFVYGLSQARFERLTSVDGQVVTASLGDYKLASYGDVPPLEIDVVEVAPSPDSPVYGAGPVGELVNVGVGPAIANAIADACGVAVSALPIEPEAIWRAARAMANMNGER